MTILNEKIRLAEVVLTVLEKEPLRYTPLLRKCISSCGSPHKFNYILKWLKQKDYIEPVLIRKKKHWRLTDKGLRFLRGLV